MEKISSKLNFKHIVISGGILAVMYALLVLVCNIAPLGDKTFLMFDMKRQYVDYYAYLKSVLSGQNNFFYSFSIALGAGAMGFFVYYLNSPFFYLLCLLPQQYLPIGITIVIGIKLVLAAMIMDGFLQYYLKSRKGIHITIGAVSWGFCSYLISQSMNMMWTDAVILFPLFIWTLDRLILGRKYLAYIILLSYLLLSNYYISYQILIFAALWTIARLIETGDGHFVKSILRVMAATLISPCIDAAALLPTALELANSPKDITQLGLETQGKNLSILDILSKIPTLAYDESEPRFGFPQIFCGVLFVFLFFMYLADRKTVLKQKLCMMGLLGIYLLSFCSDYVNLFMHAGMEPSGHPYRQAFMWIFLIILCGTTALSHISEAGPWVVGPGLVLAGICMKLALNTEYDHITDFTVKINLLLLAVYFAVFVGLLLVNLKAKNKEKFIGMIMVIMLLVQIGDLSINAVNTYNWESEYCNSYSGYKAVISGTKAAVNEIKSADTGFYRMENLTPRQQNDSMQYAYNGVTHYSSAGLTYVRYLLQRMGYNDDSLYTNYGHDNTATADMLLGIKYVISDGSVSGHSAYECTDAGSEKIYTDPYALSVAVMTDGFDLDGISMPVDDLSSDNWYENIPDSDPFSLQEDMLSRITGQKEDIFEEAEVQTEEYTEDGGNVNRDYVITTGADGELFMYLNGLLDLNQGMSVELEGEIISTYGNESSLKVLNLGYHEAGEEVKVRIYGGSSDPYFGTELFVTEKTENLEKAYERIKEKNAEVRKISSSHLQLQTSGGDGIFLSIPCEKGWKIKVDGVETEAVSIYGALTYIEIPNSLAGQERHTVDMKFVPVGFGAGVLISLISVILLALFVFLQNKNIAIHGVPRWIEKLGVVVVILAILVGIIMADAMESGDGNSGLYAKVGRDEINVFEQDGEKYLFLPSYADQDEIKLSSALKNEEVNILQSENIPAIFINTASGSMDEIYADEEHSETGRIECVDKDGNVIYKGAMSAFKGHGNYSWSSELWQKKPFSIKLDKEGELLGLGVCKNYTLIANASDPTLIRNDIARCMEMELGVAYSHEGVWADLYINGDYMGVYYLCDDLDIGQGQIDITDLEAEMDTLYSDVNISNYEVNETVEYKGRDLPLDPDDITGGYLVEREFCDRYAVEYPEIKSGFMIDSGEDFIVRSPAYCSTDEIKYIRGIFNDIDLALSSEDGYSEASGKHYSELIDISSFAKRYLVDEVSKNYDAGNSSAYFYKDSDSKGGLVVYGPGWDYDMTFGSYQDWMDYDDPTVLTYGQCNEASNQWYKKLCGREDFDRLVEEDYENLLLPYIDKLIDSEIDNKREMLSAACKMDAVRWQEMYENCGTPVGSDKAFDTLKTFIISRSDSLNKVWCR